MIMKRRIISLLCAGSLFTLTACQEDIKITEVPMPPVEEEPEPAPDDTDKIYDCEHPLLLTEQAQDASSSPTPTRAKPSGSGGPQALRTCPTLRR